MTVQFESQGYVFSYDFGVDLIQMVCPCCGVVYAMPEHFQKWCRKDPARHWYCPNGHYLHYPGKSDEQKLRDAQDALATERARRDQVEASLTAQKAATTRAQNERDRLKVRVRAGVCPCCNRTFKQLAAHMKTKHPEYAEAKS